MPNQSGHIYLVTNRYGQYRLITVARPTISGEMHGILTTLQAGRGAASDAGRGADRLVPLQAVANAEFGRIGPATSATRLPRLPGRTVEEPFALFLTV